MGRPISKYETTVKVGPGYGRENEQAFDFVQVLPDPENFADPEQPIIFKGFQLFFMWVISGIYDTQVFHPCRGENDYPTFDLPKAK